MDFSSPKRFNVLYSKLPALDFLDDLNQQSIVSGFPLLTLGIITGALSAEFARGTYVNWNPEQTWALVTWVFYFVVLVGTADCRLAGQTCGLSHDHRVCRGDSDLHWRGPQESRTGVLTCTSSSSG